MRIQVRAITVLVGVLAVAGSVIGPVTAQQSDDPVVNRVQVEEMDKVLRALQQIEKKLEVLLASSWEYRMLQRNRFSDDTQKAAAELGREGWELVNVTVEEGFIFKRRLFKQ